MSTDDTVLWTAPEVGSYEPLEAPFLFQDLVEKHVIFTGMRPVDLVVRAHERVDAPFLDRGFEGGQVHLAQGAFIDLHVDGPPAILLVVGRVVLDVGDDPLALDALDIGNRQARDQEWVLAVGLKGAPVLRHTGDVDVGRFKQGVAEVGGFAALDHAVLTRGVHVPSGGEGDRRGQGGGLTLMPRPRRTEPRRTVGHEQIGDAKARHADNDAEHPPSECAVHL